MQAVASVCIASIVAISTRGLAHPAVLTDLGAVGIAVIAHALWSYAVQRWR